MDQQPQDFHPPATDPGEGGETADWLLVACCLTVVPCLSSTQPFHEFLNLYIISSRRPEPCRQPRCVGVTVAVQAEEYVTKPHT